MYLTARADTVVGEYVNEYVWFLTFDEAGEKIVESKEFVDTIMNRDFFPKLAKAMREQQQQQQQTDGTNNKAKAGGQREGMEVNGSAR